jgi:iron-regulated transporter 1
MENKEDQTIELIEHKENKEKKNEELILHNNEKKSAIYMLISHFLTRMGDNMWEFGIPFILITITPNSLIPSSLFGLLISIIRVIFGTTLGNQIDKKDKLKIITWGTMGQAFSIICSSIFLFLLLEIKDPQLKLNIFYTWKSSILFSLLLISSMIGSLAAMLVDISVERKWVPITIKTDLYLTLINTRMRQIDLITEVSAPFIAGIILSIPGISFFIGFLIIA